ncbi:MAG: cobalt ECF transporter T component CbiQ [Termitinemataceae bacterium]|nr:MAG: cobalt ECF transporter T component CbiQ [Termitinemataceae bacterium]
MAHFHKASSGIDHIETLSMGSSCIHSLNPITKLFVTLIYIVLLVSMPSFDLSAPIMFVFYPALLMPLSNTPFKPLFARFCYALPFALFAGISNIIFMREGLFRIYGFVVTSGMVSCFSILIKTLLCVFAVLILVATTPFLALSEAMTHPKVFRVFGLQIALTYRYIGTLLGEANDMWVAYHLRAPNLKALRITDMGTFMGQLLLRSFDRADRVYSAMKCRGFSGMYHSDYQKKFMVSDYVFLFVCTLGLLVLRFFDLNKFAFGFFK